MKRVWKVLYSIPKKMKRHHMKAVKRCASHLDWTSGFDYRYPFEGPVLQWGTSGKKPLKDCSWGPDLEFVEVRKMGGGAHKTS